MILRFLKTCSSLKYQKAVLKFIFQTAFFMSIFGVNVFAQTAAKNTPPVFKLHVVKEPLQFDPALLTSGNGQFLFGQIFANLYRYDQDLQWTADLATKCYVSKNGKLLTCILKDNLKWQDGSPLTAQDFIDNWNRVLKMRLMVPQISQFFFIEGAEDYVYGRRNNLPEWKATKRLTFTIPLKRNAQEEYKVFLASILWAPAKQINKSFIGTGPFAISEIKKGQYLEIQRNPHFYVKLGDPSDDELRIRFYFIQEDTTAVRLFETGELDYLRRLPSLMISQFEKRQEFHWAPLIRFDYIGFGKSLTDPKIREGLATRLDLDAWKLLYSTPSQPGCFDIPKQWLPEKVAMEDLCVQKSNVNTPINLKNNAPLNFHFSASGGEDHRRTAEWLQFQWKKSLNAHLKIQSLENSMFQEKLPSGDFDIFRHGVGPESPDCESALNQILVFHLRDEWNQQLKKLHTAKSSNAKQLACLRSLRFLIQNHLVIPTGKISFATLLKAQWSGLELNELYQLSLRNLKRTPQMK